MKAFSEHEDIIRTLTRFLTDDGARWQVLCDGLYRNSDQEDEGEVE